MSKRKAKREACRVVARLIESYFGVGQPVNDCIDGAGGWTAEDEPVLTAAFEQIENEMRRRAGVA